MSTTFSPVTPAQLRIDTSCPSSGTVRVTAVGEIDLSTADVLRAGLLGVLSTHLPHRIEVDLAGVTFLDCSGLTVLLAVSNAAAHTGCQLRIAGPQPIVQRILDLTGLLNVLGAPFDQTPHVASTSESASSLDSTPGSATQPNGILVAA